MPYISLKTEPLFVLLWLHRVSVGQENPCGKSLLGSSCRESFGRSWQLTQGSFGAVCPCRETEPAVCQCWKEGISWTPGSLWQVSALSAHELPGCGIFPWQGLGSAGVMIYASPLSWGVFMLSWCWAAAPWNLSHYFVFVSVLIASWSLISHCKSILFRRASNQFYFVQEFFTALAYLASCVCGYLVGGDLSPCFLAPGSFKKRIQHPHKW